MSFGTRLADERNRLGLKQAAFAKLVGTTVPTQSLYENDRRELRAAYLTRLSEAGVDMIYILTGRRGDPGRLGEEASELLTAYVALPAELQQEMEALRQQGSEHRAEAVARGGRIGAGVQIELAGIQPGRAGDPEGLDSVCLGDERQQGHVPAGEPVGADQQGAAIVPPRFPGARF